MKFAGAVALVVIAVLASVANAGTITVDFESLAVDDSNFHFVDSPYTASGFTFTRDALSPTDNFFTRGTQSSNFLGSTAMVINGNVFNGQPSATVSRADGQAFSLLSIDLGPIATFAEFTVSFTGAKSSGGSVSQSFSTLSWSAYETQTFNFTGFTDLSSVSWGQSNPGHQFDNLVLAVVPLPPAAWMGLGMLGGLGLIRRLRRGAR